MNKKNLMLWTLVALILALVASSPGWLSAQYPALYASVFAAVFISSSPFLYWASERITLRFAKKKAVIFGAQIHSLNALATLKRIDAAIFVGPKLLLEGHPLITDIVGINGMDQERLLALAATIEQGAVNPIGKAIYYAAAKRGLELFRRSSFVESPLGAQSNLNGTIFRVGNIAWLEEEHGVQIPAELLTRADQLAYHGKIPVAIVGGGITRGIIALKDDVNILATGAIKKLGELGIVTRIFADEPRRFVASLERETGIVIQNGLRPLAIIREIQIMCAKGSFVAVVGNAKLEREVYWSGDLSVMVSSPASINLLNENDETTEGTTPPNGFIPDITIRSGSIYQLIPLIKLADATENILKQNKLTGIVGGIFCAAFSSGMLVTLDLPLLPLPGVIAFIAGALSVMWFNARRL